MLLAFLVSSIALAHAEPDTTSSTIGGSTSSSSDEKVPDVGEVDPDDGIGLDDTRDDDTRDDDTRDDDTRDDDAAADPEDDEAIATDRLDDASVDDPAPASISAQQAPTWAHGTDAREAMLRKHTPWFGRIDVSLTWRRALNESTAIQRDEVWLVGTWRL